MEIPAKSEKFEDDVRSCAATTKAGKPCKAPPVLGGPLCAGHSGLGLARDPVEAGRKGAQATAKVRATKAEERRMSALDWADKLIRERGEEIANAYMAAWKRGDWRAAEALMTRVYGRPVERVQVEAPTSVEDVQSMSLDDIRTLRAALGEHVPTVYPVPSKPLH